MEGGDLSNVTPPRFLFVFEGLIGRLDSVAAKKEQMYRRLKRHKKAAACWAIEPVAVSYLWDMAWRHKLAVDLVTYLPYSDELEERMEKEHLPFASVLAFESPEELCQRLAYMPYVHRIYFSEPRRPFIFGDRGEYVDSSSVFDPLS